MIENYHDQLPPDPNPMELDPRDYNSLVRHAAMFANMHGNSLEIGARDIYDHKTGEYYTTAVEVGDTGRANVHILTPQDVASLFMGPYELQGMPRQQIGMIASREIAPEDMPFGVPGQKASISVATLNEAAMAVAKRGRAESDLSSLPLAIISLSFDVDFTPEQQAEGYLDGQWMKFILLPPDQDGVARSFRIRDYGEYDSGDGVDYANPSTDYGRAVNSLNADNTAWLRRSIAYDYDFSVAAQSQDELDRHLANGGDKYDLEDYSDPYHGYIDGDKILTGYVGSDGAQALQQLIEIAMRHGKELKPVNTSSDVILRSTEFK